MINPYFAPTYMRMLYRFLRLPKDQEHRLFAGTDVTAVQLMQAEHGIAFDDQMQICRNALTLSKPGLGLRMGRQLQLAAHGALGTAMQNAADLNQALETFGRFGATRASFFQLDKTINKQHCHLMLRTEHLSDELSIFFTESILGTIDHTLTFYTGSDEADKTLCFNYPAPSYAAEYKNTFRTSVTFDAKETRLRFPKAYLQLSTYEADQDVFTDSIHRCRLELAQQSELRGLKSTLEQFLKNNPGKLWGVDEVAAELSMSPRTLMRRLREQNTTYQQIRDHVVQSQAKQYLRTMTVTATATALGFADESSFRRTFKRWFGVPPVTYRGT